MEKNKGNHRLYLIELVKASGAEVIRRAEDIVGEADCLTDIDVYLRFPVGGVPSVEVCRSHVSKETINIMRGEQE